MTDSASSNGAHAVGASGTTGSTGSTGSSGSSGGTGGTGGSAEPSAGALVSQMTEQMSRLIRDEMQLAQLETKAKAKDLGKGAGMFGGAGVLALYGLGALIAAAICLLALAVPAWLAALIVAVAIFLVAGVLALTGKKEVQQASPPVPQEAISGVRADVQTLKEHAKR